MTDQQAGVHAPTENAHLGFALAVIASAQLMIVLDTTCAAGTLPDRGQMTRSGRCRAAARTLCVVFRDSPSDLVLVDNTRSAVQ